MRGINLRRKKPNQESPTPDWRAVIIYGLAVLSVAFFLVTRFFPLDPEGIKILRLAAKEMEAAVNIIRTCRQTKGLPFDLQADPNQTGLIGLRRSILTTTLGQLEAKRTITNPDLAALVVYLLCQAGVQQGDAIAVGASSSFPGLIIASLAAAKAIKITPLYIVSLGASQWGANDPRFTWLEIQDCLEQAGWLPWEPVAVSLGGTQDLGLGMEPEGKELLLERVKAKGLRLISESDLEKNVALRLSFYETAAKGKRLAAFINIGGGWANMGENEEVLHLPPGLNIIDRSITTAKGVVWEMARRQIPVVHLLYIKGLAEKFGLSWDPQPLPRVGQSEFYLEARRSSGHFQLLASVYLLVAFVLIILYRFS